MKKTRQEVIWPYRWSYPAALYSAKKPRVIHQTMPKYHKIIKGNDNN